VPKIGVVKENIALRMEQNMKTNHPFEVMRSVSKARK
jgi:hypothetical protein